MLAFAAPASALPPSLLPNQFIASVQLGESSGECAFVWSDTYGVYRSAYGPYWMELDVTDLEAVELSLVDRSDTSEQTTYADWQDRFVGASIALGEYPDLLSVKSVAFVGDNYPRGSLYICTGVALGVGLGVVGRLFGRLSGEVHLALAELER